MKLEDLKKCAGSVSTAYLLRGQNMTEAISKLAKSENLNDEEIRRICEIANQNTYLHLFQDKEKRGDINFDTAKSEDIIKLVEEHKVDETDYTRAPEDFRKHANLIPSHTEDDETVFTPKTTKEKTPSQMADEAVMMAKLQGKLGLLHNSVKTMKYDEAAAVEDAVDKIASFCVTACSRGDGFADIAKLAMRYSSEHGGDIAANAEMLTKVADFLDRKGVRVEKELTKVSSMNINPEFELYRYVDQFNDAMLKSAGLNDLDLGMEAALTLMKAANGKQ